MNQPFIFPRLSRGTQLDGSFLKAFFIDTYKKKSFPQIGGSIAAPRLPQTQKYMKPIYIYFFNIERNIGANTDKLNKK